MSQAPAIIAGIDPVFTADTHLLHENILMIANRLEFATIEEHDEFLVGQINDVLAGVGRRAKLFHIGDAALGKRKAREQLLRRIPGPKVLIEGNHDEGTTSLPVWEFTRQTYLTQFYGQYVFMCHHAMRTWDKQHKGAWALHGHSHGALENDPRFLSMDVGVDVVHADGRRYRPFTFDEVRQHMQQRLDTGHVELEYAFGKSRVGV